MFCTSLTWAQERNIDHHREESRLETLAQELELDKDQKEKLVVLTKKYATLQKDLREKHREENCEVRKDKLDAMARFLNKDQMNTLRNKRTSSHMKRMKENHPKMYAVVLNERIQFNSKLNNSERRTIKQAREIIRKMKNDAYPCRADKTSYIEVAKLLKPIMEKHKVDLEKIQNTIKAQHHGAMENRQDEEKMHRKRIHKGEHKHLNGHKRGHRKDKMMLYFLLMKTK